MNPLPFLRSSKKHLGKRHLRKRLIGSEFLFQFVEETFHCHAVRYQRLTDVAEFGFVLDSLGVLHGAGRVGDFAFGIDAANNERIG